MGDSMRKVALNLICSLAAFATVGLGLSVAVKASVGMGSFSALATNIAVVGQWKVGTLTATLNLACLIVYMFLTQWRYPAKYVCQILATISLGEVMNFFSYYILDHVIIDAYWQQLALSVLSIVVIAPAVGLTMTLGFIGFPMESMCLAAAERGFGTFKRNRQVVDIVCAVLGILLSILFSVALTVREGTLLGMLLMPPLLQASYQWFNQRHFLQKLKLFA